MIQFECGTYCKEFKCESSHLIQVLNKWFQIEDKWICNKKLNLFIYICFHVIDNVY